MRKHERLQGKKLEGLLARFQRDIRDLPGIKRRPNQIAFVEQLIESIRRVKYVSLLHSRDLSDRRCDPTSNLFDPIMAAHLHDRNGNSEESFWLVFLAVHFGRNLRSAWTLCRDVYCGSNGAFWTWDRVQQNIDGFREWLSANQLRLKSDGTHRGFGNHRKYESLDAWKENGTGATIASYVAWATPSHYELVASASADMRGCPKRMFAHLYSSMHVVRRFGRTAKFDYLSMLGKLRLANIVPGTPYLQGATGPLRGARLMFGIKDNEVDTKVLESWVIELGGRLRVGMQEMEDSLCNWQKSPDKFIPFRG